MAIVLASGASLWGDGKAIGPAKYLGRPYQGSIEERAQEAILIFHDSEKPGDAKEDLILRVSVEGEVSHFAWVIPFPAEPEVARENVKLFADLYDYVQARLASQAAKSILVARHSDLHCGQISRPAGPLHVLPGGCRHRVHHDAVRHGVGRLHDHCAPTADRQAALRKRNVRYVTASVKLGLKDTCTGRSW
jgi:hypothetical protein